MKHLSKLIVLVIFSFTLVMCDQKDNDYPDLILVGGKIITVNETDQIAEAIAIKNNIITAIGSSEEIEKLAGENTRRIDLKNKTVTPGLLDSHIHFSDSPWNIPNVIDVSYPNVKNIAEIKELIAQKVKEVEPGVWIQGVGLDEGKLEEQRLITATEMDEVAPDNPVWLNQTTLHYGVANSQALRLADISTDTPDPAEGRIEKDERGNLTGTLKESAMNAIYRELPPSTIEDIELGISTLVAALNEEGMTGIKDPTINKRRWQAYQNALNSGDLNLRVFALWSGGKSTETIKNAIRNQSDVPEKYRVGNDHLIAGGIKIFADGSGGGRTAWLYDEWNLDVTDIDEGNFGFPNIHPDTLRIMINNVHKAGIHTSTHAIGDRTIDTVLYFYKEALLDHPTKGLRHGIIHANIPSTRALETMKELQTEYDAAYPEPSATFTWWIGDTYAGNFGNRAKRLNPFATFKEKGIIWANGSDYPVTPFPARYGIWSSIARQPAVGNYPGDPFGREESVDVKTALKSVTIWVARQMFLEDKIGSLEVGKYADLAVWDRDLYTVPVDEIKEMKCLMTIFNGDVVYQSQDFVTD